MKRFLKTTLIFYIIVSMMVGMAITSSAACPTDICKICNLQSLPAELKNTILSLISSSCGAETKSEEKVSITASKSSLSVTVGNSKTVTVTAKNTDSIKVKSSSSNVNVGISKELKNGKATIKITGKSVGTATVKIYSPDDTSKVKNIKVTVNEKASTNEPSNSTTDNTAANETDYAKEVLKYVNEARKENGLSELSLHSTLSKAAQIRAEETITKFAHTRPDGTSCFTVFDDVGLNYRSAGENIAYGYKTAKDVVDGWLASPGHRANILSSKFTYMGIGKSGTYWAQLFMS